jgi:phosphoribosylformimino-5-aminoimidazole carboxamide ribotide isomerase
MLILPAIDLRDGKCVRLKQGDYSQETIFADDPLVMGERWVGEGAKFLHLVDLDGAKEGRPINGPIIERITQSLKVPCQLGGGIRTEDHLKQVFAWGIDRAILGTRALQDPDWVRQMIVKYPNRIVLGLDARDGKVATHGWIHTSNASAIEVAQKFESTPLAAIVYTDIARDGMLTGPNIEALKEIAERISIPVIASGGIRSIEDIQSLLEHRIPAVIVGRALYEGRLDLKAAFALVHPYSRNEKGTPP